MKTDVLIIGAGLSGLVLARNLKRPSLIVEKSKGLGGRIATRRIEEQGFDHGAPYLAENSDILKLLHDHLSATAVAITKDGLIVRGGMTKFPKELGKDLLIKKSTRVESITKAPHGWIVKTDTEEEYEASIIALTAPLPQALELLHKSSIQFSEELKSLTYHMALMALVITKDGALPDLDIPNSLHSIEPMSHRDLHSRGFVVRMSPQLSKELFETRDEDALDRLVEDFKKSFSQSPTIEYQELKKWRYVVPQKTLTDSYLEVAQGLYLIGDSFISPDARGAVQSAYALAEKLNLAF